MNPLPSAPTYSDFFAIQSDVAGIVRAPRRLRVSDAAKETVRIEIPGSYSGPWDPDLSPYVVEPMNALASRKFEAVVFAGPGRTGKTLGLIDCWLAYVVTCDPGDFMVVHTSQETARDYSRRRIDRLHRHSPKLRDHLSTRRNDVNTHDRHYKNGMILTLAWPTINQLSSRDIRYIALTDYDRMSDDIDGEGDPFALAKKRNQTFLSAGMAMVESSPGWEIVDPRWKKDPAAPHEAPPTKGILSLYNQGDRRRLYWCCPACASWFEPTFSLLTWTDSVDLHAAADSVRLSCPDCGTAHGPESKRDLNRAGKWVAEGQTIDEDGNVVGEARRSNFASFWLQGPAAAYQSWRSLVLNQLNAEQEYERTGSEEQLKTTTNVDQGCPYLPRARQADRNPRIYEERAEAVEKKTIPAGVRFLQASVDVQGGRQSRFVVQVVGHGVRRERWIIDRFNVRYFEPEGYKGDRQDLDRIDPAGHIEHWDVLTRQVIGKLYPLADGSGRKMRVRRVGCDSGGEAGVTANAYAWFRSLRRAGLHREVMLLKGGSTKRAPRVKKTYPDSTNNSQRKANARGEIPLWLLNTNELKDTIAADLERDEPGPAFIHFPEWLGEWFFRELTYEVKTARGWEKPGKGANEAFDLLCYDQAMYIIEGGEKMDWANPRVWARPWDENPDVVPGDGEPVEPKQDAKKQPSRRRRIRFK